MVYSCVCNMCVDFYGQCDQKYKVRHEELLLNSDLKLDTVIIVNWTLILK